MSLYRRIMTYLLIFISVTLGATLLAAIVIVAKEQRLMSLVSLIHEQWLNILGIILIMYLIVIIFSLSISYKLNEQFELLQQSVKIVEQGKNLVIPGKIEVYQETYYVLNALRRIAKKIRVGAEIQQNIVNNKSLSQIKAEEIIKQERSRLARELHDSVSQQLFAASMMLSALREQTSEKNPQYKQVERVEKIVQDTQMEMRALLLHLRPMDLKNKTLPEGIVDFLRELQIKSSIDIHWQIDETIQLESGVEDHLYRILQEALSNILRHAHAHHVEIELSRLTQVILLRIKDDGVGFEMNDEKMTSYGLKTMKERALEIGADYRVVTYPNVGTRIEIKLPVTQSTEKINL